MHSKEKLEKLLKQPKYADVSRQMVDDDEMGPLVVNPIFLVPKNEYLKTVIDTSYLNSVKDLKNYSWPLEPAQVIMNLANGKFFTVSDLSRACHQVKLRLETQKLAGFIVEGRQCTYTCRRYGLFGLPNFFIR